MKSRRCLLASLVFPLLSTVAPAVAREEPSIQCIHVRLVTAHGVIGEDHKYTFTAECRRHLTKVEKNALQQTSKTTNVEDLDFDVIGRGHWVRKTGRATEEVKMSGEVIGTRFTSATCKQDPFLKEYQASCSDVTVQVEIKGNSVPASIIDMKKVLLRHSFSVADAKSLSLISGAGTPNPPPPPPPPGSKANAWPTEVALEAEDLIKAGRVTVSKGSAVEQMMTPFGQGWSNNKQLFWAEAADGASMELTVNVPASGNYAIALYLTRAPDYGNLRFLVDGKPASSFPGFGPAVATSGRVPLGTFALAGGPRKITLTLTGKARESKGFLVGVDKITLKRIDE
jgi:hypothetical protein